jgi:hypothetical protein
MTNLFYHGQRISHSDESLGSVSGYSNDSRFLVIQQENSSYQLPGDGGSIPCSKKVNTYGQSSKRSDSIRQYLSGTIYQQTKGGKVLFPMYTSLEFVAVAIQKQNLIERSTFCRQIEHSSRSVESSRNKTD